jgi:hypothetical protein
VIKKLNFLIIEHYFEMSRIDAKDALSIYRDFCKQTERVVEYLGVAKKLQNILNVPIPNLKHVGAMCPQLSRVLILRRQLLRPQYLWQEHYRNISTIPILNRTGSSTKRVRVVAITMRQSSAIPLNLQLLIKVSSVISDYWLEPHSHRSCLMKSTHLLS